MKKHSKKHDVKETKMAKKNDKEEPEVEEAAVVEEETAPSPVPAIGQIIFVNHEGKKCPAIVNFASASLVSATAFPIGGGAIGKMNITFGEGEDQWSWDAPAATEPEEEKKAEE